MDGTGVINSRHPLEIEARSIDGIARSDGHRVLLNPWFLIALGVLILNDHFLKEWYPSWITGKLSDFAGLLVFAVFLKVVMARWLKSPIRVLVLHATIGVAFVIWKLAPVEMLLDWAAEFTSWPMPSRVRDATDLAALPVLAFSYWFLIRERESKFSSLSDSILARLATCFVMISAGAAIMATSFPTPPEIECCVGIRGNVDGSEDNAIDMSDLAYLVDYLFNDGPRPPCLLEADVDASADKNPITEADMIYLRKYMFEDGPPPPDCWEWRGGPEL